MEGKIGATSPKKFWNPIGKLLGTNASESEAQASANWPFLCKASSFHER